MGIKDKQTYGEYYWAMAAEKEAFWDEQKETAFAPLFAGVLAEIPDRDAIPAGLRAMVERLANPQSAGFGGFALGVGVEMIDEVLRSAMGPAMKMLSRSMNRAGRETWLTSEQAGKLLHRKKITDDLFNEVTASEGYEEVLGQFIYESTRPFPSIPDMILWSRYHGPTDNVYGTVKEKIDISDIDFPVWEWLGKQRLTTLQAHTLYRRELISAGDYGHIMSQIGWDATDTNYLGESSWSIPNAMLLVQAGLLQGKQTDEILAAISIADIHPDYAKDYLDAVLTKPASADIVAHQLRKDASLSGLGKELERIGIHPDYTDIYKTLAYPIPPVADIITMAVREAFTPAIASRFGQYDDFPPDFEKYAGMKGLSPEWAKRYWAAHWSLPSVQQGFEMLHRGIIGESDLNMLMKALDIMPFWRERLMSMSYRRLTRVDVRRMYREGVLDEAEVYQSYLDLGYASENARRMADFTVAQALSVVSKFSTSDILKAYTTRKINRSDTRSLLAMIGIRSEDMDFIISTADYKKEWALTDQKIAAIKNLYKKRVYDANDARDKLSRLNLPSEQIDTYMEQWHYEQGAEPSQTWSTAQILTYAKKDIITLERAKQELKLNGYDDEHINVYVKAIQWTKPIS